MARWLSSCCFDRGASRKCRSTRPRCSRFDPAYGACGRETAALSGAGSLPPLRRHAHWRRSGHDSHFGAARQYCAPRSSIAWLKEAESRAGRSSSARRCASTRPSGALARARASTRPTLVSSTATGWANAKLATAWAVYCPRREVAANHRRDLARRPRIVTNDAGCVVQSLGATRVTQPTPRDENCGE